MEEKLLDETIKLLQELVKNKCINPPGDEMKSIKTVEKFLTDKGISCQVFESAPNRGNLIARIKGTGEGKSMMFGPSHVDVVPIENPDAWDVPPFSGEIKDGQVWGRGTFDMLFIVVAQCQAFAMLHKENFKPKGDLILAIVADEEAGGLFGTKWMIDNHPEVMKVDNAVSEFGGLQIAENKLILPYGEKGVVGIRLTFRGESGHASRHSSYKQIQNALHNRISQTYSERIWCRVPSTTVAFPKNTLTNCFENDEKRINISSRFITRNE
ncbi:MAG: M20/M25/M40 family metallo-hydrolase [Candidatus Heimdallarchaeota archaeon]